jgi:integrase
MTNQIKPNYFAGMRGTKQITRSNGKVYTIRNTRQRFFFPDEWVAFFEVLKLKQKITFHFLVNTGARINEIRNIKVSDVDLERGNIVLRITKRIINISPRRILKMKANNIDIKGERKIRVISVSSQFIKYIRAVIKEYGLKQDDYFPILSTPAANIAMKNALQKANISDWDMFSLHNVRKTLETWLLALDVDSFKIVKHFGHTSAVALKHYVSGDTFSYNDKMTMRMIIGDLFRHREVI